MAVINNVPFDLAPIVSANEHLFMLREADRFVRFLRKDDLLDEGVAALFGVAGAEAELLGLCFHVRQFSPDRVAAWLTERIFARRAEAPILVRVTRP